MGNHAESHSRKISAISMEDKRLKGFWLLWFVLRVCEVKKNMMSCI